MSVFNLTHGFEIHDKPDSYIHLKEVVYGCSLCLENTYSLFGASLNLLYRNNSHTGKVSRLKQECSYIVADQCSKRALVFELVAPPPGTNSFGVKRACNLKNKRYIRGNVGENQRGAPTCRRNLCSYSGYQKYS